MLCRFRQKRAGLIGGRGGVTTGTTADNADTGDIPTANLIDHTEWKLAGPAGHLRVDRWVWEARYVRALLIVDFGATLLATLAAFVLRFHGALYARWYLLLSALNPAAWLAILALCHAYERKILFVGPEECQRVIRAGMHLTVGSAVERDPLGRRHGNGHLFSAGFRYRSAVRPVRRADHTVGPGRAADRPTAVFPPTQLPTGNPATGTLPSSYERATVTYLDANARTVNTADPGGYLDTTWYDSYGTVVQELGAGNRQCALDASTTDTAAGRRQGGGDPHAPTPVDLQR